MGNNNYGKLGIPLENTFKNYPIQIPFVIGFIIYPNLMFKFKIFKNKAEKLKKFVVE